MWTNPCRLCTICLSGAESLLQLTPPGYLYNHKVHNADLSPFQIPPALEFEVLYHIRLHSDRIPTYQPFDKSNKSRGNLNLSAYHNTIFRPSRLEQFPKSWKLGRNNTVSSRDGLHGNGRGSSIYCEHAWWFVDVQKAQRHANNTSSPHPHQYLTTSNRHGIPSLLPTMDVDCRPPLHHAHRKFYGLQ